MTLMSGHQKDRLESCSNRDPAPTRLLAKKANDVLPTTSHSIMHKKANLMTNQFPVLV